MFENPIYVSVEEEPELLQILFRDGSLFLSEDGLPLDLTQKARRLSSEGNSSRYLSSESSEGLLLEKRIPKQLSKDKGDVAAMNTISSVSESSQAALLFNFILNLLLSASLQQIWSMINTQQIIVMLPLFNLSLPTNAEDFFNGIF